MSRNKIIWPNIAILALVILLVAGCSPTSTPSPTATAPAELNITTTALTNATVGITYSRTLQAAGGSGGYNWTISEGSLPTGFSLAAKTGSISGTPLTPGTSKFKVQVTDSAGKTATKEYSITILGAPIPLAIRTSALLNGEIATAYSQPLLAFGGNGPYSWSISGGSLPDGLTIDQNSGVIAGTPQATGKFLFSPQVKDTSGTIATTALRITIVPTLNMTTKQLDEGEVGTEYNVSVDVADGVEKYNWSVVDGKLPDGVTLNADSGSIFGRPTAAGKFNVTVQVKDIWNATVTSPFTIKINEAITLTTTSLPNGKVGVPYSQVLQFKGGNGTTIWAKAGGNLPDGLDFDGNTGAITGTPKTAGTFTFSAEVIDSFGASDLKDLTLIVDPA